MKTFSMTMVTLVATTGFVLAQGAAKAPAGAGSAAGGAKAPAGAGSAAGGAKAPAGAGSAAGGAKAPAGAGSAAAPAGAGSAAAAPKMEMPKPPAEIAAAAKMMKKLNCTGEGMGPDMKMAKMKGTSSAKADLDGWWIRNNINGTVGEGKASFKMKMEQLMTYDAKAAKWRVMGISNDGGSMIGTADLKDGKYDFVGEMTSPMGVVAFKDHGDMTDKKAVKFWGEMSMDKGKTWTKVYDLTCK